MLARFTYSLASALIYGSQSLTPFFGVFYIGKCKFGWLCCFRTSFACSDFLFHKKSVTRSAVPPFPKKCSLGSPIRLQARSCTARSRYHLFSGCSTSANINLVSFVIFGQALLVPIFYFIKNQSHYFKPFLKQRRA